MWTECELQEGKQVQWVLSIQSEGVGDVLPQCDELPQGLLVGKTRRSWALGGATLVPTGGLRVAPRVSTPR